MIIRRKRQKESGNRSKRERESRRGKEMIRNAGGKGK